MPTNIENTPEPVVLIIADISGYTGYMTANAKALAHGQALITELVTTILNQVALPLRVAKLEGDAVFLFARKRDSSSWPENRKLIGAKLLRLFEGFAAKVEELSSATTCTCEACTHIEKLKLKIIVHSGEALFHRVLQFEELAGVDVIIVHRLLKNSVKSNQYLLLTRQAQNDIELPSNISLTQGRETCDGIGEIEVGLYIPDDAPTTLTPSVTTSFSTRLSNSWRLFLKLWFKALEFWPDGSERKFSHLAPKVGRAKRVAFGLLTLILTPIYLPVGAAFVLAHALKKPVPTHAPLTHSHEHERKPDGSCCGFHPKS